VSLFRRRVLLVLADGCGWGDKPRNAARTAAETFTNVCALMVALDISLSLCVGLLLTTACGIAQFITERQTEPSTVQAVAELLLQGVAMAHLAITAHGGQWEVGTTTMLGGLLVQVETTNSTAAPWCFVAVSVGDCKCFHISQRDGHVSEITCGNRINISQPTDPGGRIGPYVQSISLSHISCALYCIIQWHHHHQQQQTINNSRR
jgi:hypothetical protein